MNEIYISSFGVSFLFVSIKAFQQLNVVHHKMLWAIPASFGLGLCEVFIIGTVSYSVVDGARIFNLILIGLSLGAGGALGVVSSMIVHKNLRGNP